MFCPKCGNKLVDGSKFCNKCGTPVQITIKNEINRTEEAEESVKSKKHTSGRLIPVIIVSVCSLALGIVCFFILFHFGNTQKAFTKEPITEQYSGESETSSDETGKNEAEENETDEINPKTKKKACCITNDSKINNGATRLLTL